MGGEIDTIPQAPSHRWILVPMSDGSITLGGMDRGRFAAYGKFRDPELVVEALVRATIAPPPLPEDRPLKALVAATQGLLDQLRPTLADGRETGVTDLPVGAVFDHIGSSSGHVLYLFATPLLHPQHPGSPGWRMERVQPWFGQPGGGWTLVLDRVIAYYADQGVLSPFSVDEGALIPHAD